MVVIVVFMRILTGDCLRFVWRLPISEETALKALLVLVVQYDELGHLCDDDIVILIIIIIIIIIIINIIMMIIMMMIKKE